MQNDLNRWQKIERLGEGGQGEVFLVRTPSRVESRQKAKGRIPWTLGNIGGYEGQLSDTVVQELLTAIGEYNRPETADELGALKQFKISPDDAQEQERAIGRLGAEVSALKKIKHPAVLKLLHDNVDEHFIVTEYHRRGTLAKNLGQYKGNALEALRAFRILVDGVYAIHCENAIHRDIKAENIFVGDSGDLVLGDFGIVFFSEGGRVTSTFERVGSPFWMAPWAYKNNRLALDEINYKLDIYPLGKVLWSMISGQDGLHREEFKLPENNLEELFPDDPIMPLVNDMLAKCIVRQESDCVLRTSLDLRFAVDTLIETIKARRGQRPDGSNAWPCRMCGKGYYRRAVGQAYGNATVGELSLLPQVSGAGPDLNQPFSIFACDRCKHAEFFLPGDVHRA